LFSSTFLQEIVLEKSLTGLPPASLCEPSFSSAANNGNSRREDLGRQSLPPLSVPKVFSIPKLLNNKAVRDLRKVVSKHKKL